NTTLLALAGTETERVGSGAPPKPTTWIPAAGFLGEASSGRLLKVNSLVTCQPADANSPMSAPTYLCPVSSGTYGVTSREATRGGTTPVPSGGGASVPNGVIACISSRLSLVRQFAPGVAMQLSRTR